MVEMGWIDEELFKIGETIITPFTLFVMILVLFCTKYIIIGVQKVLFSRILKNRSDVEKYRVETVFSFVKYIIYIVVIIITLNVLKIQTTFLMVSFSALLVAIGFGLKELFSDIASGIIMILERSITVNDVVEIDGVVAKVNKVGLRSTIVISQDNKVTVVPNSKFVMQSFHNWTQNSYFVRAKIGVQVAYGSDTKLVEQILLDVASEHLKVSKKPKPVVMFSNFGESGLNFDLFYYTKQPFNEPVISSDIRFEINNKFIENKIEIPFPQMVLHQK